MKNYMRIFVLLAMFAIGTLCVNAQTKNAVKKTVTQQTVINDISDCEGLFVSTQDIGEQVTLYTRNGKLYADVFIYRLAGANNIECKYTDGKLTIEDENEGIKYNLVHIGKGKFKGVGSHTYNKAYNVNLNRQNLIVGDWSMEVPYNNEIKTTLHLLFNSNGKCECRLDGNVSTEMFDWNCFASVPGKYTISGTQISIIFDMSKFYYRPIKTEFHIDVTREQESYVQKNMVSPADVQFKNTLKAALMALPNSSRLAGSYSVSYNKLTIDGKVFNNEGHFDREAKQYVTQNNTKKR